MIVFVQPFVEGALVYPMPEGRLGQNRCLGPMFHWWATIYLTNRDDKDAATWTVSYSQKQVDLIKLRHGFDGFPQREENKQEKSWHAPP